MRTGVSVAFMWRVRIGCLIAANEKTPKTA